MVRASTELDLADFCATETPKARAALAERQLAALAEREAIVRAFVCVDVEAARRRIAEPPTGALGGALIGVKDIIATEAFPTMYGSRHPENAGPRVDAWCVAAALRQGATLLGKTVCTEFAIALPGPTTNPHDATRTPGGSSSGSAAAVAAGFVSFALGTQTAGSTIRPASYCGITGFKPSYGLLHLEGIQAISTTLDHVGIFARSPRDAWYFTSALAAHHVEIVKSRQPRRLLVLRLPSQVPQGDGFPQRLATLAESLRAEGVTADTLDLPFPVDDFMRLQQELCYWESARILLTQGRMRLAPELETLLRPYLAIDVAHYAAARRRRQAYQGQFAALAESYDALLLPAATGVAPPSLSDTGDAVMSRFWTALHVPTFTIPLWRSVEGLPLGLQMLGALGSDRALAEVAQWFYERR
jgi:Asp-tRNA(Asn)/Glu-tRNA(Gln) amidotransferase A subunit family amidase